MQKIVMQVFGSENEYYTAFHNSASTNKNAEDFLFSYFPGTVFQTLKKFIGRCWNTVGIIIAFNVIKCGRKIIWLGNELVAWETLFQEQNRKGVE